MKIGMILDSTYPPDPRVRSEALTLLAAGHEVSLFCIDHDNREKEEILEGISVYRNYFNRNLYKKVFALAYSIPAYQLLLRPLIKRFLIDHDFDVVHIHDMIIAGIGLPMARNLGKKVVLDLHEDRPSIMKLYTHVNSGIGRYLISIKKWQRMQCKLVKNADQVIVVTDEARQVLIEECEIKASKVHWVPNTLNLSNFRNYPRDNTIIEKYKDKYVILYLGNTGIRRGTDTLIEAVSKLKGKIENLLLVLVGSSRDDKYLKQLAKDSGVDEFVNFCGWKDESLFTSYLEAANVCVSPLKKNRHHDTTYANKLFQYMSEAKPVIVSNCDAQANVVIECGCGLIHEPGSVDSLALKILEIYNDPILSREMGLRGKAAVENKYNWEYSKEQLLEIYT
ncbi:MAG: glycosyltransferase family 4 protein [Candidatus Stygibacter frigidus]|nr:glycosyltransferase family 4 protein [Candidatus Stygibacter frigidus]